MSQELESRQERIPGRAIWSYFLRLTIAKKMMLGYVALVIVMVIISVFAVANLKRMNSLNESILNKDVPILKASEKMVDALLGQEMYARRYLIMGSPELLKFFWEREKEFNALLEEVTRLMDREGYPVEQVKVWHDEYDKIIVDALDASAMATGEDALGKDFDKRLRAVQDSIVKATKQIGTMALAEQTRKTGETASIGGHALRVAWALCIVGVLLSVLAAMVITRNIAGAIHELRAATVRISEGQFDYEPRIRNTDELGDLAHAFIDMAKRLKRLEEMYLDASPLTHLPGGVAIENVLKKRVESNVPFAFCLMDMDNFKAYNDRYGYSKGNTMIQMLAGVVEKAVKEHGSGDDFVGHVGGDDFVVITDVTSFTGICNSVIKDFDDAIPWYYDEQDRVRGCIRGFNRQGEPVSYPLASISIAVVTSLSHVFESHLRVGEIAAELKEYAKSIPGSMYVVDQRRDVKGRSGDGEGDSVSGAEKGNETDAG